MKISINHLLNSTKHFNININNIIYKYSLQLHLHLNNTSIKSLNTINKIYTALIQNNYNLDDLKCNKKEIICTILRLNKNISKQSKKKINIEKAKISKLLEGQCLKEYIE